MFCILSNSHTCQFWEIHTLVYYRYLSLPNSLCSDFSLLCWIDFNTHSQISHCCSKPGSTWFVINLFLPQSRSPKQNGVWLVLTCATFLQSHAGSKNSEVYKVWYVFVNCIVPYVKWQWATLGTSLQGVCYVQ